MNLKTFLPFLLLGLTLCACARQPVTAAATTNPVSIATKVVLPATVTAAPTVPLTPTTTNTLIPPDLPAVASPTLTRIEFLDEQSGWGFASNDNGHILRTVDGGNTWLDATPPGIGAIGYSASLTALNPEQAWVLLPTTDFFSGTLYRTSDGGLTWDSNPLPFGSALLQFQDAKNGEALTGQGFAAGSEAVELFRTKDGGASWTSVFHDNPSQPGASDSLPLSGVKNGMTFLDANTGWVTGTRPLNGDLYVYVTHDGGTSWSQQELALPAGYQAYQYMPEAPVFFGEAGLLPLITYLSNTTALSFYTTQDGGLTWQGDPSDPNRTIQPGLVAFADALHGWSWDGGKSIFGTSNAGQTWTEENPDIDLSGKLAQMEFVPAPNGSFIGWALTQVDETGHTQLYSSKDGAKWIALIP